MDLRIKHTSVGETPQWLDDTETLRMLVGGVTIDASTVPLVNGKRIIKSGTPIGRLASGLWGPADDAAADGRENPVALLWPTLDVTEANKHGSAMDHGRVRVGRLPVAVSAAQQQKLQAVGINFRP